MRLLSPDELQQLLPAETHALRGPVPTQIMRRGMGRSNRRYGYVVRG